MGEKPGLGEGFPLGCFQRYPVRTWLSSGAPGGDNWWTRGSSVPVLSYLGDSFPQASMRAADRDRTASARRSKLQLACRFNGRTAKPLGPAQPQDATS